MSLTEWLKTDLWFSNYNYSLASQNNKNQDLLLKSILIIYKNKDYWISRICLPEGEYSRAGINRQCIAGKVMLSELNIKNFAIIDDLTINFDEGLNILSGETGAGKSIIISALNLILGGRPSASLIRAGASEAEIEALFHVPENSRPIEIINANGIYTEDGIIIIRRIISSAGKNKIYINGRMAPVQILSEISEHLASISGQHAHQLLMKEEEHIGILDSFGCLEMEREEYSSKYREFLPLAEELERLRKLNTSKNQQNELLIFQKGEIEAAAIKKGEDEELLKERQRLKNSVLLQQTAFECHNGLYSGQNSAYSALMEIRKNLEKASKADPDMAGFIEKSDEIIFRIEDLASELKTYQDGIEANPERLEQIEARLDLISKLKKKYGGSVESILSHLSSISSELEELDDMDERIIKLEKEISERLRNLQGLARSLSEKRKKAGHELDRAIEKELAALNMKGTVFCTRIADLQSGTLPSSVKGDAEIHLSSSGMDRVIFMIAPNRGEELKPLSATASGGELSRVVLAIKSAMATDGQVETVVFDEVDTGIGGATAEAVGEKIASISSGRQVICITHLAQIAKFGHHHYLIEKNLKGDRTATSIKKLSDDERVGEIARMIGGQTITDATLNHARELLSRAGA